MDPELSDDSDDNDELSDSSDAAVPEEIIPLDPRHTPEFEIIEGIKIYTGTTPALRDQHANNIVLLRQNDCPFTALTPSTLTAQGQMTNVSFNEEELIRKLPEPTQYILLIGCNHGELFNPVYQPKVVVKTSSRGRKPRPKDTKRRVQGNGKYFSSQITFLIQHPCTMQTYPIKLFRNGRFQVPGVKDPSMHDLIKPILILKEYLEMVFKRNIEVVSFVSVMRNYKCCLKETKYHVDLEALDKIIGQEKQALVFRNYMKKIIIYPDQIKQKLDFFNTKNNPIDIAERTYNTDKCFYLSIKFRRPISFEPKKKTTVKLLKKGKINFDGGNSEIEITELYHWLASIYNKYKDQILVDVSAIENTFKTDEMQQALANSEPLYDEPEESKKKTYRKNKPEIPPEDDNPFEESREEVKNIRKNYK